MLKIRQSGDVTLFHMGRSIGPFVPYSVHAFLVDDMLIDTGTVYARDEFITALKDTSVRMIINTHHHEDHTGNNRIIQRMSNSSIYAHPDTLHYLENPEAINLRFYQRFVWDWPEPSQGEPIGDCIAISDYTFNVIHTPGHCSDHICLYEPDRKWLFTGDIFCGRAVRYLRADEDFHIILSSLKKLADLNFDTMFCCLKGAVSDGKSALLSKIDYMEELKGNVMDLHAHGFSTRSIRRKLLGREDAMFYLTGAHFSKQHVIDSILSRKISDS
jgi:glyoxylase-like metal-dependent hydrolase (beta-lactamase superfamily II)